MSRSFEISLGVKQGGINSPDYFSCFVDDLIGTLRKCRVGCSVYKLCLAVILFADDICLLAPTRSALQRLIDSSAAFCDAHGLTFNPSKSKILVFSRKKVDFSQLQPVRLNGANVDFVTSISYLGVKIESNRGLCFSAADDLRTFYRAANSILTALHKPSEEILMQLLYTNCVPILSYACNIKQFSAQDMRNCNTAINDAIRKIFTFNRWESVRTLRESFGMKSIYEMFATASDNFQSSLLSHHNSVLRQLCNISI